MAVLESGSRVVVLSWADRCIELRENAGSGHNTVPRGSSVALHGTWSQMV